jgi:hypothetical protein
MAIDRISKSAPPPPETYGPSPTRGSAAPFEASRTGAAATQSASATPVHTPLERLRVGQVDLDGYLDLKVDEATSHLSSLPPVELGAIRQALRDRLAADPTLVDLVQMATGKIPESSDD